MTTTINASTSSGLVNTADTSGVLALQTASTTAVTIDTSQRVGIGTASPSNKLTVNTSSGYDGIAVNNSSTTTATRIVMNNDTSQYLQLDVGSSGRSSYGASGPNTVSVTTGATGGFNIGTDNAYPFAMYTNGSERMRITSAGYVGIGTTSPSAPLNVQAIATNGLAMRINGRSSDNYGELSFWNNANSTNYAVVGADQAAMYFGTNASLPLSIQTGATERMRIEAGGNINLNSVVYANTTVNAANMFLNSGPIYQIYRSTSSIRYKKDVETIENSYSEALLQCRPVWFRSSCSGDNKDYGYWGFIAEEVAEIDPRLVFLTTTETIQNEDGESVTVNLEKPRVDGVQYDRFVPHLLNLIKKQNETLTQQAETINALTARVASLEGK